MSLRVYGFVAVSMLAGAVYWLCQADLFMAGLCLFTILVAASIHKDEP